MNAEWNVNVTAEMTSDENLLNTCQQIEQEYVTWQRHATIGGYAIVREWPSIGELGRYGVDGVRVQFATTRNRTVEVRNRAGSTIATFQIKAGLAEELYLTARAVVRGGG